MGFYLNKGSSQVPNKMIAFKLLFLTAACLVGTAVASPVLRDNLKGTVWPKPRQAISSKKTYSVAVEHFTFTLTSALLPPCDVITEGLRRYEKLIKRSMNNGDKIHFRASDDSTLRTLNVELGTSKCENLPTEDMNEAYTLDVGAVPLLYAESVWGVLRGLETFSQLLWETETNEVMINETHIVDAPRFSFRGIMIDTSRHYLPVRVIHKVMEGMEYNKMNVLHWHIVDDQSFPFVSKTFPNLHKKGAYDPSTHIYTGEDVSSVIEFGRLRGIRIIPEYDTPGHTQSWGKGQAGLLTACYGKDGEPNGQFGPINPVNEANYKFVGKLWKEIRSLFPDKYIHLGGDEVNFDCWKSNPEISKFMQAANITGNYPKLEQYYIQKVINISNEAGFSYIVWQEVIDNGVEAKKDTVVEIWTGNVKAELSKMTLKGYKVLVSQPWYLNIIHYGQDWQNYYRFEPLDFEGSEAQKKLVMGGEACIWGEYVDATNILSRLWPRASAVAERLWSSEDVNDVTEALPRLNKQRCMMIKRGLPAESLYIGYCKEEWANF